MSLLPGSRSRSAPHQFGGLDVLRACAISFVLLYHYQIFHHPEWIERAGSFGWTGVDLFFVLSGFLIAGQLFSSLAKNQPVSFKHFYLKRFFRIIPPYLTVVAIYFMIPAFREREALPPLWKFITFTQNLGLDIRNTGTFSHAWSLCIEEQFYLLLPFAIFLFTRNNIREKGFLILPLLFLLGFFIRGFIWTYFAKPYLDTDQFGLEWYRHIYYPIYTRLDGLLAGVALAALSHFLPRFWQRISRLGNWLLVTGVLLLIMAYFVCEDEYSFHASVFGFPLIAIAYGMIVAAAISPSCFLSRISNPITNSLATLSYSIYLSHKGVIHLAQKFFVKLGLESDGNLMFLASIAASILAAIVLRWVVEKPSMALRDKLLQEKIK